MGPMRAACRFARDIAAPDAATHGLLERVARVQVELYGSLALTGLGHATDRAVLLGLSGYEAATIDPAAIGSTVASIRAAMRIHLAGAKTVSYTHLDVYKRQGLKHELIAAHLDGEPLLVQYKTNTGFNAKPIHCLLYTSSKLRGAAKFRRGVPSGRDSSNGRLYQ